MKKILILNGPNLNLLGAREPQVYGSLGFEEYLGRLRQEFAARAELDYFQSNVEGELIDRLHRAAGGQDGVYNGVILNAGGYTHTSVALADAVGGVRDLGLETVEVHISNILAREEFRHVSLIAPRCRGSVMGFGLESYRLALLSFL